METLECKICGFESKQLTSHITMKHKMKIDEYKDKYNVDKVLLVNNKTKLKNKLGSKRCKEFWMSEGYSEDEAIKKVSEHQSVFSLDKCIEKYGEHLGYIKWKERQDRWQRTLNSKPDGEIKDINNSKDSSSITHYKEKYGDKWKEEIISRKYNDKRVAMKCLSNCDNLTDLIKFIPDNFSYKKIKQILNSKIIREVFGVNDTNENQLYKQILSEYDFNIIESNMRFGKLVIYDGIIYRSMGEVEIAKFMTENNIQFIYERAYPNQAVVGGSKLLYDFYLKDYNYYIEYTGLSGGNNEYDKRLLKKRQFCLDNGISVFFSNSTETVICKIKEVVNE